MSDAGTAPVPSVGVVVLTQGTRPGSLPAALGSVLAQRGVDLDVVCVGNGWAPAGLPIGVRTVHLEKNVGIPAGRNAGAAAVGGSYLFFLDDDEWVPSASFLHDAVRTLSERGAGMLQPRIRVPGGAAPRRWVPRLRKGDPARSSTVMAVVEGAVVVRRDVFDAAGGWAESFRYAHEGIDLCWRVWDQRLVVWYAGDLEAMHPAVDPTRHDEYWYLNARNRVWVAKRNLPWLLVPVYVGVWTGVHLVRRASGALRGRGDANAKAWWSGWRAGWREPVDGRQRMRWATVYRMLRHGRPPIV